MNTNNNFSLSVSEVAFTFQDLQINTDGGPASDPGRKVRLYDLPKIIIIENVSAFDMNVKWMNVDEGDGTDGTWTGMALTSGSMIKVTLSEIEQFFFRVGAEMKTTGTGNLNISGLDYQNIFVN